MDLENLMEDEFLIRQDEVEFIAWMGRELLETASSSHGGVIISIDRDSCMAVAMALGAGLEVIDGDGE